MWRAITRFPVNGRHDPGASTAPPVSESVGRRDPAVRMWRFSALTSFACIVTNNELC